MLLELRGEDRNSVVNFQNAARVIAAVAPNDMPGALDADLGIDAAIVPVLRELFEDNGSSLLELLQEDTPEGLLEMLLVPGLGPAKVRSIHEGLNVDTIQDLELATRDGRLAALPRFGEKTAEKIRKGIADLRASGAPMLWQHANNIAERLQRVLSSRPEVARVAIAGSIRRCSETVRDIDIVVAVNGSPSVVAAMLANELPGAHDTIGGGGRTVAVRLDDGVRLDLACVRPEQFALAEWRATGSNSHVREVINHALSAGYTIAADELRDARGAILPVISEADFFRQIGLAYIEPELREDSGEVEAARLHQMPKLVSVQDIVGAVHCHSQYSDGGATIVDMANAAIALGWKYLGISDHSQSNTYAGGLAREAILKQHEEIAGVNAAFVRDGVDFRILQGIEADILPCGRVDYDAQFLDRFDFVIASIHSRYGMDERQMTERVLKSLDDPHVTILGHPTGRLLLTREPYAIDMNAVIEKAGAVGVAIELNADPHRIDIDWQMCKLAKTHGTMVSIGPDAHSPQGLQNIALGIATARKGWLEATDIVNSRSADSVLEFARARRIPAIH